MKQTSLLYPFLKLFEDPLNLFSKTIFETHTSVMAITTSATLNFAELPWH